MNILNLYPQIHPQSIMQEVDEECIILLPEKGKLTVLNTTGQQIWEWIDGKRTVQQITALLQQAYNLNSEQAYQDLVSFLEDLQKRGLIALQEHPWNVS
jgi:uncharacterized protein YpbB